MKKIIYLNLFIIFVLLPFNLSFAAVKTPQNPNSAKACAICHYRWIDTFFIEGKGSDLVAYQPDKVVATPDMCFSCHDGSVMDSRARVFNDYGHKSNIPPPDHMKIPEIFPLDEGGKMQCSTCHTAHGVPSGTGIKESIFMRTSNRDSTMCRMCHPDPDGGIDAGNHPLDTTKQEIPAKLVAQGAVSGQKKNQVICETCHTAHGSPYEGYLVESSGESGLCLECHRDKDIFRPDGKKKPFHIINARPVNVKIPESLMKRGAKLGDNGVITCETCHKVHNNKIERQLLLIPQDNKSGFCLTCHSDKASIADTKHNLVHSAPGEKNLAGQTVAEAGICSACHLPHKSARKLSAEKDFTTQLCLSCHQKGQIAEKFNLTGNTHPLEVNPFEKKDTNAALATSDVDKEKLILPLFNKYGVQDKNGKMTCSTCHDTHRLPTDSSKRETSHNENGNPIRSTSFLRKRSPEICRECHNNKFSIANSKHDLNQSAPAEKNILNQTPSQSGLCGICHLVHGSKRGFLWAREVSAKKGTIVQGMCTSCHQEKGIAKKKVHKGYSHPLNITPAQKTSLPLFDARGKSARDGVVKCHTCHDPHRWRPGSSEGKTAKDAGDGIAATSFLRKSSPDVCRECHQNKFHIANSKHDLSKVAPKEKNSMQQTPSESGICGTCHLVHNARGSYLWARKTTTQNARLAEQLCIGCHNEKGLARKKIIKDHSHPVDIAPAEKGLTTTLPLFNKNGKNTDDGVMSCQTCHDPHRWDPLKTLAADHFDIEGNSQNSFLRIENSPSPKLCENCHPGKAHIEKTDHDLSITAPYSKNIIDQTPAEAGTCGVCHLVHNGKNQIKLWAQDFGRGESLMDTMCSSCHSEKGRAKNKIPLIATHPISKVVNLGYNIKGRPNYFPLFHRISGQPVIVGEISCPSCHNVHQWNPGSPAKGKGVNLEGNAINSFLRAPSAMLLCKNCHSIDAIFKFKYYHDPGKRKKLKN